MEKLTQDSPETRSLDVVAENIAQLKALFPEATTEGRIDFEVLKQLLGSALDERDEKYGLNWHGKRQARQLALSPSSGTVRPCKSESVDWDTTQNLLIEGDNLEVLKLIQKNLSGKVKLIYIDPPYNTGKDFVYPDDYRDNINNYLELTGQIEGGKKITSNSESRGRLHTDWLNMMYPRLKLARNLLREDGAIFISIDDSEAHDLRLICDEIFGSENFVAQIVWEKMYTTKNDASEISASHDYILVYARRDASNSGIGLLPRTDAMDARYTNPDNDPRGPWKPIPMYADGERKNGRYTIVGPTGIGFEPPPNSHWRYVESDVLDLIADNRVWFGQKQDGQPNQKRFLSELNAGVKSKTLWPHKEVGSNDTASREIKQIFKTQDAPFSFPKPTTLLSRIIELGASDKDSIVLDFFAGSGTTGHAVMAKNAADGGSRRFILVQLPEPIEADNKEQAAAYAYCCQNKLHPSISSLTKERLRKSGELIKSESPLFKGDVGFRVFKLDSSNIRPWEGESDNLAQTLMEAVEHIKEGRTEQDLLFELLLKLGLDLTVPMEQKTIAGKTVHSIGAGVLMVCLDEAIAKADYEALGNGLVAWHRELAPTGETTLVFRDSAFADDVVKTNLTAILSQGGLDNVRSL